MPIMNIGLITNRLKATRLSLSRPSWSLPPAVPVIGNDEIQVWMARLDDENAAGLKEILSDAERARAERFRSQPQRNRWIVARGILRIILGKCLEISPDKVSFEYSMYGKPSIFAASRAKIRFNLSHSDGLALYAVTSGREIGVDLERLQPFLLDARTIAECLTPLERERLQILPDNDRERFFFDCWTRKESYLKALGEGLMVSPNQIETTLFSESSGVIKNGDKVRQIHHSFQNLPPIPGYAAALVVEGSDVRLRFWLMNNK
ncbi:4'-phosphopantetheinyl transferase superfamily protein [soil metagenome]